jgi:hypothetical protein
MMGGGNTPIASPIMAEAENISAHMGRARPIEKIERMPFFLLRGTSPPFAWNL